jgi:hypothetical protein
MAQHHIPVVVIGGETVQGMPGIRK